MGTGSSSDVAALVLDLARDRAPTLGQARLICLDGPGGSGKTTLAAALVSRAPAHVVHMDDLYDGWDGLPRVGDQLDGLLRPLAQGVPGRYRRYDWVSRGFAETVTVPPTGLIVLEGVGSGSRAQADLCTVLVWVSAPPGLRLDRGLARDGQHLRDQWLQWRVDEEAHFAREGTEGRADVVVDGTGAAPAHLRPE